MISKEKFCKFCDTYMKNSEKIDQVGKILDFDFFCDDNAISTTFYIIEDLLTELLVDKIQDKNPNIDYDMINEMIWDAIYKLFRKQPAYIEEKDTIVNTYEELYDLIATF